MSFVKIFVSLVVKRIYHYDHQDGKHEAHKVPFITLLMPFFIKVTLKFIRNPSLQFDNFESVRICAMCTSFNASTALIL